MPKTNTNIFGFCDSRFHRVRDEFERNFHERNELGASVCVTLGGETIIDLWGGVAEAETSRPWEEDTISIVWSCTKGATALCAHILVSRGQLDLDAPVSRYWPEFAQAGKEAIPVRMLLNHQAGMVAIRTPVPAGGFADSDLMMRLIAGEPPFWTPGTRHGYHVMTMGWLIGALVQRISGKSLGRFFRDEVAAPLGLDFWIGLPEELEPRVAPMIMPPPTIESTYFRAMMTDPSSLQALVINDGGIMAQINSRAVHAAEIGAANGITNARGLAGMYTPLACGGHHKGVKLVDSASITRMMAVSSASAQDVVLLMPLRCSLGYMKSMDNRRLPPGLQESVLMSEQAFGHSGFGGSLGFADPGERLAFGYTMNRMGNGILMNDRGQSLINAVYLSLGYTSNESGVWVK